MLLIAEFYEMKVRVLDTAVTCLLACLLPAHYVRYSAALPRQLATVNPISAYGSI